MDTSHPYLVLGLDPGIASCGFCLLDMTNHKILEMGSHLFEAPQDPKTKESYAVTRRNARSVRRNTLRTSIRLRHCLKLLNEAGLVPDGADKAWLQSRKGDKPILKLRARGLDMPLTDRELAQVLYSLCSHRGYIPHGEGHAGETDDAEGRKVLNAIKKNSEAMTSGRYRTVGEMLYAEGRSRNKGGNYTYCVYNSQIQDEAKALFTTQRDLGNEKASQSLENAYLTCLTWEKKTLDHDWRVYELVGKCSYFPECKRAASADVSSELCGAYERLGHLVIVDEFGHETTLTKDRINRYLSILFSTTPLKRNKDCKVRYSDIRKDLNLSEKSMFKGIAREQESRSEPFAPKAWRCLRSHDIPPELLKRMSDDRELGDQIGEALTFASTEASLLRRLEPLDLTENERKIICGLPFAGKLFKGYGKRSLKALDMLLDAFEDDSVRTLKDVEEASGLLALRLSDRGVRTKLLPPYTAYDQDCRNPVVLRAMGRMRHIVNAIIRIYDVPDEIHIELGRELKQSKHEKSVISKRQKANEKASKEWASVAAKVLGIESEAVPKRIVHKLIMREEQSDRDLYTGTPIPLEALVRDDRCCEIDHILPYSRTCDDSRNNKVLVFSKSNQDKRERTPYEWMNSGEDGVPNWDEYRNRVIAIVKKPRQRANLLNTNLSDPKVQADFLARNLNDDRYMSRAVKDYLEDCLTFPEDGRVKHVSAVAGGATGNLRWVWGLNSGKNGNKDRADDRHHAVDAAIIAACSDATVKKVAEASALGHNTFKQMRESRLASTQPWPTFANEVIARREFVIPTRMVSHGVTGRVFEDTLYRLDGYTNDRGKYPIVSVDKAIDGKRQRKSDKKGNVFFTPDGSVRLVDGMAFLCLWLDPTARPKGKVKGRWYAEPVYYADIPAIKNGTYVPKAIVQNVARLNWPEIPKSARQTSPLILYHGDVLVVDNHIGRYWSIGITKCQLQMLHLKSKEHITDFPSIGSWGRDTRVSIIQEDCLGHCYDHIIIQPDNSFFEVRS